MRKLAFIVVFLSAGILLWKIHLYPIRLGIYEGLNGLTALKVVEGDQVEIGHVWAKPREMQIMGVGGCLSGNHSAFFIYPTAFFIKVFGVDRYYISLRASGIMFGVLSVWLLYLILSKMFSRPVGVIGAFIMATSSWFIGFSRICQDWSATIFFSLLCIYVYIQSDRGRNPIGYIVLGALMALSPYFYGPARMIVPLLGLIILIRIVTERGYLRTYWPSLIFMADAFLIVLLLEGIKLKGFHSTNVPNFEWFWVRYGFHPHDCATPWEYLVKILTFAYDRFFVQWGWFRDIVGERDACLGPVTRYLLLLGLVWSIVKIRNRRYRLLLVWFIAMALPALLTQTWFRRSLQVIPAIAALAAVGVYNTLSLATSWIKKGRNVVLSILVLAVLFPVAWINLNHYFGLYREERYTRGMLQERRNREKFIELLKKYKVYSSLFQSEKGWPEGMIFEARRLDREAYYTGSPDEKRMRAAFDADPRPCALITRSGRVEIKEKTPSQ